MIQSVTITNYLQESVKIELTEPESSGFIIRSIEGLGPAKANINLTELATLDGALDNGALLGTRNIVMSLIFVGTPTIEDTRLKSYKYFPIKQNLKFEIETDNRHCYTVGRVESNTPTIFGDDREGCQISILCPNSYFQDMDDTVVNFMAADSGFEFPFENNSLSEGGKNILHLNSLIWTWRGMDFTIYPDTIIDVSGYSESYNFGAYNNIQVAKTATSLPVGRYRLSGCPEDGGANTYSIRLTGGSISGTVLAEDTGSGIIFENTTAGYKIVYICIRTNKAIDTRFSPMLRSVITIDNEDVEVGENLLDQNASYISIISPVNINLEIKNGEVKVTKSSRNPGDHTAFSYELQLSGLENLQNNEEYILSGCPTSEISPGADYYSENELKIVNSSGETVVSNTTSEVRFTKSSEHDKLILKTTVYYDYYTRVLYQPMIRHGYVEDSTFEPNKPMVDAGPMIEFGSINASPSGNVFYLGDAETGMDIEIHANGSANGIGLYRFDTNEQITINDTRLIGIVGSGIRAGDTIIISTLKGNKRIRLLRDGIYYNILNALNAPISWFNLRKGDNGFWLDASYGVSNLQYKVTYRTLYEGV